MSTTRVLVLCTGNSCRSQMAEALVKAAAAKAGLDMEVHSAGTRPAVAVHPRAVATMQQIGIDIHKAIPKSVFLFVGQRFDYVITVCDNAAETCPIFPGDYSRLHWPTFDPSTLPPDDEPTIAAAFARTRDELAARIDQWLATLPAKPKA
jgi:arsenate reductase